jgi:lysozyme family protein
MKVNFAPSLSAVLVHEGGFVNNPRDPGGATNKGVTQAAYDDYRASQGLRQQTVRNIATDEVSAIYEGRYWDAIRGDDLPSGVDYCCFDLAVNSGVSRAVRFLQAAVSVAQDGAIGPVTVAAASALPAAELIDAICDARQAFLERLPTFNTFGRGWTQRVVEVRAGAKAMANA